MSRALALVGAIAALVGGVLLFAQVELFDPGSLGEDAAVALADEDVRLAISPTIATAIGEFSPADEPTAEEVALTLEDPRVAAAFEAAAGAAGRRLFERDAEAVDLELANVTATAIAVSEGVSPQESGISAADVESTRLTLIGGDAVLDVLEAAEGPLGVILAALGAIALLLSVVVARDRLRALTFACMAIAVAAALLIAAIYVGREIVLAQFTDQLTQDAVSGAWEALLGGLRTWALVLGGAAVVVAIGSSSAAGGRGPEY